MTMENTDLMPDEKLLLKRYRLAKALKHARLEVAVKDAVLVNLVVAESVDLAGLREAPRR